MQLISLEHVCENDIIRKTMVANSIKEAIQTYMINYIRKRDSKNHTIKNFHYTKESSERCVVKGNGYRSESLKEWVEFKITADVVSVNGYEIVVEPKKEIA